MVKGVRVTGVVDNDYVGRQAASQEQSKEAVWGC